MTDRPGVERIAGVLREVGLVPDRDASNDHVPWEAWEREATDKLASRLYDAGLRVVDSPEPGPFGVRVVSESSNLPGFRAATPAPPEPVELPQARLDLDTLLYVRESIAGIESVGGTVNPLVLIDSIISVRAEVRGEGDET